MSKLFISANDLLCDAFELALEIINSQFKPDLIVGIWRGGTPVAIAIHEALGLAGMESDHTVIRTSSYTSYTDIAQRSTVRVDNLAYIEQHCEEVNSILLVDDVFDTGLSMQAVIRELKTIFKEKAVTIKIATPYFKPTNNLSELLPDYYLHKTDQWIVFPHELIGLQDAEILENKPELIAPLEKLLSFKPSEKK